MIEIPLTQGYVAVVDDIDADLVAYGWYAHKGKAGYYARRNVGKRPNRSTIYLHQTIMERILGRELSREERVDHIFGDTLDNKRNKLRLATPSQNAFNSGNRTNTNLYKGVTFNKKLGKYVAQIGYKLQRIHIGVFDTPEEAKEAYDNKALELFGKFICRKENNIGE